MRKWKMESRQAVKGALLAAVLGIGACVLAAPGTQTAQAQSGAAVQRVIQGKVFAASGGEQSGAVVYLKNLKSLEIKTYISTPDGAFRFGQLGTQEDYQLWAEFGGHKTKTKNISSFDSKKRFDVSLHLEDK